MPTSSRSPIPSFPVLQPLPVQREVFLKVLPRHLLYRLSQAVALHLSSTCNSIPSQACSSIGVKFETRALPRCIRVIVSMCWKEVKAWKAAGSEVPAEKPAAQTTALDPPWCGRLHLLIFRKALLSVRPVQAPLIPPLQQHHAIRMPALSRALEQHIASTHARHAHHQPARVTLHSPGPRAASAAAVPPASVHAAPSPYPCRPCPF